MTRSLRQSLLALGFISSIALVIHLSTQPVAQASLPANTRISPLSLMADSMMNVTEDLDAEIKTLSRKALSATEELSKLNVTRSEEATWLVRRVRELSADISRGLPAARPDPFQLNSRINQQQQMVDELSSLLNQREVMIEHLPTGLPAFGRFTSDYGYRVHPISGTKKLHKGIDIAAKTGTPITAAGSGTVIFAGVMGGYGNVVQIDHGFGYVSLYAHASKLHVKEGDIVERGDLVARVGSTGASTGPHLHFEVIVDSEHADPASFLAPHITHAPHVAAVESELKEAL